MRTIVISLALAASVLSGAVVAQAASGASAQGPPDPTGDWRLSEVGGKVACTLTFTHDSSAGGFEVKAPLACRRAFPPLETVAAWALDPKGGIVLSDAQAKPIVDFPEGADGGYEGKAPNGQTWRLDPLPLRPVAAA